jgi:membrane protein involved in colicin uptake
VGRKKGLYVRRIFISVLLVLGAAVPAWAQDISAVELQIERLRSQLRDVVDLEARLQERASQLDEELKPENVERSVAAVGTTDAAALRARRREELEKQKADVNGQLSEAAAKRSRLESEVAASEAEAVRLKAASLAPRAASPGVTPVAAPALPAAAPAVRKKAPAKKSTPRKRNRPKRRI